MKIYIDDCQIKVHNYNKMVTSFTEIDFTNKWIQLFAASFNTINLAYLKSENIKLTNVKGVYSKTIVIGYRRKQVVEPYFDYVYFGNEGLERLLRESDYIILTLPLNDETHNLIDKSKFLLMKDNVVLINIARG